MMLGIVVSNGVLLVDYMNVPPWPSEVWRFMKPCCSGGAYTACAHFNDVPRDRLRAAPDGHRLGTGGETNAPLARAVIGGLSVSTMLTLFLIPTLYLDVGRTFPRRRSPENRRATETDDYGYAVGTSDRYPAHWTLKMRDRTTRGDSDVRSMYGGKERFQMLSANPKSPDDANAART